MKNKKINYLLGLLVVIIWGSIIYRVVAALNGDSDLPPPQAKPRETYNDRALTSDTAHLHTGYRDPFGQIKLRDTAGSIPVKKLVLSSVNVSRPAAKPLINWDMISYRGFIRNPGSKKLIAIMMVNGKPVMLAEGERSGAVKLLRNLRDSVSVEYQGHHKFIQINPAAL
ncbi:hypothetical protein [Mucilaginibacter sp. NFX135]|uniref:hypothetical protein n=1 Tax=Mucilaginibacter sp. NFX135 TaxID=3402687 RepID=UPI003AFB443E